jgi:outer membrane receptor protein involved in Fe transport
VTVNAGDAVSQGVDLSGQFRITPRLVFNGTYSYTDAHLTQNADNVVVSQGVAYPVYAGDRLPDRPNIPPAQLTYTYPLGEGAA